MTPDDVRAWVPTVVMVGSLLVHGLWMVFRLGQSNRDAARDRAENVSKHDTLDHGIAEADRKARAAHLRIDESEKRITRLEADNENTAAMLARSMGSLERALEATNKRIDALLSQLAHNGGHS